MMFVLIQPEAKLLLFPTQNYFLTCFALLAVAIVGTQIGELQKENLDKVENDWIAWGSDCFGVHLFICSLNLNHQAGTGFLQCLDINVIR